MRVIVLALVATLVGSVATADTRIVYAEDGQGDRIAIATVDLTDAGPYIINMNGDVFTDISCPCARSNALRGRANTGATSRTHTTSTAISPPT